MIYHILITILFIYSIKELSKFLGKDKLTPFINGEKTEDVETLLNRIDYFNNVNKDINFNAFNIISSISITLFVCFYVYENIEIKNFFGIFFIIFVCLSSLRSFYEHHVIKSMHHCVDKNLKILRKKLNCKRFKNLKRNYLKNHMCDYYIFK
jgi:hypothetical protein